MLTPPPPPSPPAPTVWRTGRALFTAQAVSGGLGVLAWFVAARTHPAAAVGTALALVGALTWAGLVGNLGLGSLLVGLLPKARRAERAGLAGTATATATAVGALIGLAAAVVLRALGGGLAEAACQPLVIAALVIGGAGWSAGVVLDHVAVAGARPRLTVLRAAVGGVARLVVLGVTLLVGWRTGTALVVGWAAAIALGTLAEGALLWSHHHLALHRRVAAATWAPLARLGIQTHYGVNVLGQTPPMALPVLLAVAGRPVQAAAFGAAWQIASTVGLLSPAVATGLFAAGSAGQRSGATGATRHALLAIVVPAAVILAAFAPQLLALIGPEYVATGITALRILALGLLADAVTNIEVARLRIGERYRGAMAINGTILVGALVVAAALAPAWGASGAATGWLVGEVLGVAVALFTIRSLARRSTPHADLARLRLAPTGTGERGGPAHAPPRRRPARHGTRGGDPARHRRGSPHPADARLRPAPPFGRPGPGDDFAA
jgi:O-antigen/teichoic acid export membrane protein